MNAIWIIMAVCALAILLSAINSLRLPARHRRNIRRARRVIRKVSPMEDAQALTYLRKIDPYVFEELVLEAFRRCGWTVYRNRRYTGDGGVDGCIRRGSMTRVIQCKRYRGHISPAHVKDFALKCRVMETEGDFVHTGRTGAGAWEMLHEYPEVRIWSGGKLLALIRGTIR